MKIPIALMLGIVIGITGMMMFNKQIYYSLLIHAYNCGEYAGEETQYSYWMFSRDAKQKYSKLHQFTPVEAFPNVYCKD